MLTVYNQSAANWYKIACRCWRPVERYRKSSLLEGLTNLNFPIASDLCTRHATQIILRRAPEVAIKVSIIPGPTVNRDELHTLNLQSFAKTLDEIEFTTERFKSILDEVRREPGL